MFIADKNDIKIGQTIWSAFDDRPFDGFGYSKGIVTEIFNDHYLYRDIDLDIDNVWGLLDDEPCSVANFTTEQEAIDWLRG